MKQLKQLTHRPLYKGRVVDLEVDTVELPNGRTCDLEIVRHPGAAAIVPIDNEGQVLLVRQHRYATGGDLLEIPAGKLDPREEPEACARREVEEETGFAAGKIKSLGWIWMTPGYSDEKIWLYLAQRLRPTEQRLDADEIITIERLPLAAAVQAAVAGQITDAKSVCGLLRAAHILQKGRLP